MTEFRRFAHIPILEDFSYSRVYCLFSLVMSKIDTLFTLNWNANLAIPIIFV
jgi:hypothetical protein